MSNKPMVIREVSAADLAEWVRLRHELWPDAPGGELEEECRAFLRGERRAALPEVVLVVDRGNGVGPGLGGMQEVSVRGAVEGCATGSVAYLGALVVDRDLRRQGWARRLVEAAEQWARGRGCLEIASDVLAGNHVSHRVHLKLGYGHTRALIGFRKPLLRDEAVVVPQAAVKASLLAEPIDPSSVVSQVQTPSASEIRMAAGVVTSRVDSHGRDLAGEQFTESASAREALTQAAQSVRTEQDLTRSAVIVRSGYVAVGETWGVAAVSCNDAERAQDGAEELLKRAGDESVVSRQDVWRGQSMEQTGRDVKENAAPVVGQTKPA